MIRRTLACSTLALACSAALGAEGARVDYEARAGLSYSDNVSRTDSNKEDALAMTAGIDGSIGRPTGRLRYEAEADLAFYQYLSQGIGSDLAGHAGFAGAYDFVPERFGWNAGLSYGQARRDLLRPAAPGNREDIVGFSTGPTARLHFSRVAELQLDGHYARQFYSDRPFDNETLGGRALLARRATPRSSLALGYSYDDVSYVGSALTELFDFDRQEVFGRVDLRGVRTDVELEAGHATINGNLVNSGGFFMRADLSRRLTPMVTGFVRAVREYPTSSASYGWGFEGGELDDTTLLTSGPRKSTDLSAGLRLQAPRTRARLAVTWREDVSLVENVGRRRITGVRADLSRALRPRVDAGINFSYSDEDFTIFERSATESVVGARLGIDSGRAMGVQVRLQYRDRKDRGIWTGYSEFSGGVFLVYKGNRAPDQ